MRTVTAAARRRTCPSATAPSRSARPASDPGPPSAYCWSRAARRFRRAARRRRHVAVAVGRLAAERSARHRGRDRRRAVDVRPTPAGTGCSPGPRTCSSRLEIPLLTLIDTPGAEPGPAAERDGLAAAIGDAMDAVLTCRARDRRRSCVGEGGSGGALAAACCDTLLVAPDSYLAALAPEGAASALHRPADEVARLYGLRPADLLALGLADAAVPGRGLRLLRPDHRGRHRQAELARTGPPAVRARAAMVRTACTDLFELSLCVIGWSWHCDVDVKGCSQRVPQKVTSATVERLEDAVTCSNYARETSAAIG